MTRTRFLSPFLLVILACGTISAGCQTFDRFSWPDHKVVDKKFLTITGVTFVSGFVNARSAIQNRQMREPVNPMMQGLVKTGALRTYIVNGAIDFTASAFGFETKRCHWKYWGVPQSVVITGQGVSFGWNIYLSRHR